jgi:hypothetical protein
VVDIIGGDDGGWVIIATTVVTDRTATHEHRGEVEERIAEAVGHARLPGDRLTVRSLFHRRHETRIIVVAPFWKMATSSARKNESSAEDAAEELHYVDQAEASTHRGDAVTVMHDLAGGIDPPG